MSEALLVLLGATVGAVGSVVGSVVVNRRELTRAARVHIYRDLLPELLRDVLHPWGGLELVTSKAPTIAERLEDVYRACVTAGKKESGLALRAVHLWADRESVERREELETDEFGEQIPDFAFGARRQEFTEKVHATLLELESFVERKIR